MTLEIDLERVAEVTTRLRRHNALTESVHEHLAALGHRMGIEAEVAPVIAVTERLAGELAVTTGILIRAAEQAALADVHTAADTELRSFAGGSVLCSAIQLASPIPARPSTSGASGLIDAAGIAMDAGSLVGAAATPLHVAGRTAPVGSLVASVVDTLLCRLRVGSGAPISTRTTIDEDGRKIYEGSGSTQPYMTSDGLTLDPDPVRRDVQMWRAEHSNESGLLVPYPGFPAYPVNAPSAGSGTSATTEEHP